MMQLSVVTKPLKDIHRTKHHWDIVCFLVAAKIAVVDA
jgi:hypothetical protein